MQFAKNLLRPFRMQDKISPDQTITVYHYTCPSAWKSIKEGSELNNFRTGIIPTKPFIINTNDKAEETMVIFALLEPEPKNWIHNRYFKESWECLISKIGEVLLELELNLSKDNAYVVDRGYGDTLWGMYSRIPKKYRNKTRQELENAYYGSIIPLTQYLNEEKKLNYSLPEVVILENIPFDRIKVSEQQPLIEYFYGRLGIRRDKNLLKSIPELEEWYRNYSERKKPGNPEMGFSI